MKALPFWLRMQTIECTWDKQLSAGSKKGVGFNLLYIFKECDVFIQNNCIRFISASLPIAMMNSPENCNVTEKGFTLTHNSRAGSMLEVKSRWPELKAAG